MFFAQQVTLERFDKMVDKAGTTDQPDRNAVLYNWYRTQRWVGRKAFENLFIFGLG